VTLVLWDIDLTLVDYSGIGRRWYTEALSNVFGIALRQLPEFPGRTERSLTVELLTTHGMAGDEESVQLMFAELIRLAGAARPDLSTVGRALPGAAEALAAIGGRSDVVQSLVTGNLPELAGYKLEPFGLDRHVDFEVGGYGSRSLDRHDLVSEAMALASSKYGREFSPPSVVVIGDSPLDMRAGLHHGTVTVGVATGRHSEEQLRQAGAHAVLPSLADTTAVLELLLSP
jgi:phosphoglycolate phosphatase-like HAD superfamily hydrolase